jgi:hypothetical protein
MTDKVALNESQITTHNELLLHLLAAREKLMMVDPKSLELNMHIQWNEELYQVGLAISAVQGAILTSISERYAKTLPAIERAADKLTDDLYKLKVANDVIAAVSSVLGTISSIVTLLG